MKAEGDDPEIDLSAMNDLQAALEGDLGAVATSAGQLATAQVGLGSASGLFDQVNTKAVVWAHEHAADLVTGIDDATRTEIQALLEQGIADNIGIDGIIESLSQGYAFSEYRAALIANTEVANANSQGALVGYKAAKENGVHVKKEWLLGPNSCDICVANADEGPIELDEAFPSGDMAPLAHPNCLIGSSLVSPCGEVAATTKRWFKGDVVVIRTSGNQQISLTPNHPILTNHGWVAAGLLKEGDDVICGRLRDGVSSVIGDNYYHVPTRIEEITEAFGKSGGVSASEMEPSPEYFHGDGEGGDITIVRPDRKLFDKVNSTLPQEGGKTNLVVTDVSRLTPSGVSAFDFLGVGVLASPDSVMGGGNPGQPDFGRGMEIFEPNSLGHCSGSDAALDKPDPDDGARNAVSERDGLFGVSGEVSLDYLGTWQIDPVSSHRIVSVASQMFEGYVYNMQTSAGFYIADGIIVHNCTCALTPVIED